MFNVVGKHLVQEDGGEWKAEETRGGWALPQKVEHPPSLNSWLRPCLPEKTKEEGGSGWRRKT